MASRVLSIVALAVILQSFGWSQPAQSDITAIRVTLDRLQKADTAGDLDAIIAEYAEDSMLMPPNKSLVQGKGAIREHYARLLAQTKLEVSIASDEIVSVGDLAYVRGTTTVSATPRTGGEAKHGGGKYLMILRRNHSRQWQVLRLMWDTGETSSELQHDSR
jgi:uncharacterized protein (TIGR02246 family)